MEAEALEATLVSYNALLASAWARGLQLRSRGFQPDLVTCNQAQKSQV